MLQRLHELRVARLAELMRDIPDMDRDIAVVIDLVRERGHCREVSLALRG